MYQNLDSHDELIYLCSPIL